MILQIHKNATHIITKYTLLSVILIITFVLLCQLSAQLFTKQQLRVVSGKIKFVEVKIIGYGSGSRYQSGSAINSLRITLNNKKSYDIELMGNQWNIQNILRKGDQVTIYYPSLIYKFLSLDFGNTVCQIELNNQILYSFNQKKQNLWPFVCVLIVSEFIFGYFLLDWYKPSSP